MAVPAAPIRTYAEAARDPEVRVILVTGAGKGFCAGADMGLLQSVMSGSVTPGGGRAEPAPEIGNGAREDFKKEREMVFDFLRKVPVQMAKMQAGGTHMPQGEGARSYIPLKVNSAGVMPIIFARRLNFWKSIIMHQFLAASR